MTFLARASDDPASLVAPIRRMLADIDRDKPPIDIRTVEQYLSEQMNGPRQYTFLLGLFGVIATLLATIGIYSVMAYTVAQRQREIGIRMALGADGRAVLRLVMRQAVTLIWIGLALGLAGSWALTRLLAQELWGVTATDPRTFVTAALALSAVALVASSVPARYAASVSPTVALRQE
jgi:putative ABC transport system permease protein